MIFIYLNDFTPSADTTFEQALPALSRLICLPASGVTAAIFPWILWFIWLARNALIFENIDLCPADIVCKAIRLANEWLVALPQKTPIRLNRSHHRSLSRTSPDIIVCCTDAAWRSQDKAAGCGWSSTDSAGCIIGQRSSAEPFVASPLMA